MSSSHDGLQFGLVEDTEGAVTTNPRRDASGVSPVREGNAAGLLPVYFLDYVVDLRRPGASGLSDIVWDMATEFDRQGGEAHVFAPYDASPRPQSGVRLHRFPVPPPGYRNVAGHVAIVLSALREIRRVGRRGIIHAPEYLSTGIVAPLAGMPVVLTVPGSIFEKLDSGANPYDWTLTPVLRLTARLSARYCASVVATSKEMERWWARTGVPRHRLLRIPLGIDAARFNPGGRERARLGAERDEVILLSVGRLSRENAIDTILHALPAVVAAEPRARLHVAGSGPLETDLRALAARLGVADRVVWLGWVDSKELPSLYSSSDLFVFTATTGGLPRVVIEAMACGAPVVATRISGVTDHVIDGQTGYLFAVEQSGPLAELIVGALAAPEERERVASAAVAHVQSYLSWHAVVSELIERIYRPLSEATGP
jgi:glycosyltransferase involved in cell wall biosynthesis